jgi:uncharacterized protein YhjY with autotransporter beta-barrel domain
LPRKSLKSPNSLRDAFGFNSSSKALGLEGDAGPGDGGSPLISGGQIVGIVSAAFNPSGTNVQYGTIGVIAPLLQGKNINWLRGEGVEVLGRASNEATPQSDSSDKKETRSRSNSSRSADFPLVFMDQRAVSATLFSGLPMANAVQSAGIRAAGLATRDANSRLTRLRARRRTNETLWGEADSEAKSNLSQFLAFTAEQGIDTAEALGLNDETDRPSFDILIPGGAFASAAAGAAMPWDGGGGKIVTFADEAKRWAIFANGDTSIYEQDPIGQSRGFTTEAGSGSVGIEHHLNDRFAFGSTWSYITSETDVSGVGDYDTDGWAASAYASYYNNGLWGDLLYSYGDFDITTERTASSRSSAAGETEANTHQIDLNLGYNFETQKIVHGPIFGANYLTGKTDAFTENGSGTANLIYGETGSESLTTLLGWQTTFTHAMGNGVLTTQLRAGWGHEHLNDEELTSVRLAQSPFFGVDGTEAGGFGVSSRAPRPSSDYIMLGVGIDYAPNEAFFIGIDIQTRLLRDDASEQFGSLRAGYRW